MSDEPMAVPGGWATLLDGPARADLERAALPAFLRAQRWFGGKSRTIDAVRFADWGVLPVPGAVAFFATVEVTFVGGGTDLYSVPLAVSPGAAARPGTLARLTGPDGDAVLHDALADDAVCAVLLAAVGEGRKVRTRHGVVRGLPTAAFADLRGDPREPLAAVRAPAASSNSLVFFGGRLLMKLFRRLSEGVNPDFEIGRFLTERTRFDRIPKVAGALVCERDGKELTLGILQALVPNQGDGWAHALDELARYYDRATGPAPPPDARPLTELVGARLPAAVLDAVGDYLTAATVLGHRTAEMHRALAADAADPDFAPEPLTAADADALREETLAQARAALEALRANVDRLPAETAAAARTLLEAGPALLDRLAAADEAVPASAKTRIHGDYHLGQVLWAGGDYVVIDFEGEPTRTVDERRAKFSPVRDVAGMLRSYHYAAYAGLFAFTKDRPDDFARLRPWADVWGRWASAAFLREYLSAAGDAAFLPRDPAALAALLDRFTLAKALYELVYELNNRPDWVRIPLSGVLELLGELNTKAPAPSGAVATLQPTPPSETPVANDTAPALTDLDMYLWAEGSHARAYEKLGAHPATRDGKAGTRFAVWAPNADEVSVIGGFNGWVPGANRLHPVGSSGIWEAFVPDVGPGETYKYALRNRQTGYRVQKTDPFGYSAEMRPSTASVVCDLNNYKWGDGEWMGYRKGVNAIGAPMSVYEVHLGSWRRAPENNGWLTYRDLAPLLADYCADMGFTHVELLPITEHPFDGSWGYQTVGYFAPTSRFGTPEDFMFLVDTLHKRGVGVILDWVPAHFPRDEHGLGYFDGTHLYEHGDPKQGLHQDWGTLIYNYGRHEVASFLLSSALFWLDKYHLDGLRVDAVASMLYLDYSRKEGEWLPNKYGGRENLEAIDFLKKMNEQVYKEYPDTVTVAEESTAWPQVSRPTYTGGLGFGYKWDMGWMHDTLKYLSLDSIHRKYHHGLLSFRMLYAWGENYMLPLSHDEVVHGKGSLIRKMAGDEWQKFANLRLLFGYMFAQPGKKLIFMGCEFGQWREWNHDASLDWHLLDNPRHSGLQRWVRDLNTFYRGERAMHERDCNSGGFEWIDADDAENSVASFIRKGNSGAADVLVVCNFTPIPRYNYRIGVPDGGHWNEVLNSDAPLYGGSGQGNFGGANAAPMPCHGRPYTLTLTIPPLGLVAFKRTR